MRNGRPTHLYVVIPIAVVAIATIILGGASRLSSPASGLFVDSGHNGLVINLIGGTLFAIIVALFATRDAAREARERRKALQQVSETEARFEAFMQNCPSFVFIKDEEGRMVYSNRALEKFWGVNFIRDWVGKSDFELWPREIAEKLRATDLEVLSSDEPLERIEEVPLKDGEIRQFLSVKFRFLFSGERRLLGGFAYDITERRAAELALHASEQLNRGILQGTQDAIDVLDTAGRLLVRIDNGQSRQVNDGVPLCAGTVFTSLWDHADRAAVEHAISIARTGIVAEFEGRCLKAEGDGQWWHVVVSPMRTSDGIVDRLLAVSRNISVRKTVEEQLKVSEARYRELFEFNPLPALIYDVSTLRFLDANHKALSTYGYSLEQLRELRLTDIVLDANDSVTSSAPGALRQRHCVKSGAARTVEVTTHAIDWLRSPAELMMVNDITQRIESEEKFRVLFEQSMDPHLLGDEKWRIVDCNQAAVRMAGAESKEDLIGLSGAALLPGHQPNGQTLQQFTAYQRARLKAEGAIRFDCVHRRLDGSEIPLDLAISKVQVNGRPMVLVVWHDLTERKHGERALLESEARLREAQQIARVGDWEVDSGTGRVTWSPGIYRIMGMDPGEEPMSIAGFEERVHPDDRERLFSITAAMLADGSPYDVEYRIVRPDGTVRYVSSRAERKLDSLGAVCGLHGSMLDITERRKVEDELRQALAEKDVLFKEVHHRVKNNLQVVCSLLELQAADVLDPELAVALRESRDRVQSMAMIHELLYGSRNVADLDFAEYATRLVHELSASYGMHSKQARLKMNIAPLRLGLDRAIPCGLILNELLSNAFKYAFPNDRAGEVSVSVTYREPGCACLSVEDDGIGLPAEFSVERARSLGLRIVKILCAQLDGKLQFETRNGAHFHAVFPLADPHHP